MKLSKYTRDLLLDNFKTYLKSPYTFTNNVVTVTSDKDFKSVSNILYVLCHSAKIDSHNLTFEISQ